MKLGEELDKKKSVEFKSNVVEAIKVGGLALSIQASSGHYSFPREDMKSYKDYTSFELMLMKEDFSNFRFKKSSKFRKFPRYNELLESYDGMGIFGWVAADLLEDLIDYLEK